MSVLPLAFSGANQGQELVASLLVVAETAEHGAGDGLAVLFFDTAHLHAQMARLDDDADTFGTDLALNGLCNLAGHALLNLEAARKHVHQAGDLAEPEHALVRQVSDVGFAEEREEVMFAKAEELDVFHDDHLVVGDAEGSAVEEDV